MKLLLHLQRNKAFISIIFLQLLSSSGLLFITVAAEADQLQDDASTADLGKRFSSIFAVCIFLHYVYACGFTHTDTVETPTICVDLF